MFMANFLINHVENQIFISNVADKESPIFVNDIGWHKTNSGHTYGPAKRPYYLIHLIISGSGTIERNGQVTKLSSGDAFIIRPDEITTYVADKTNPWEYCWISFYGNYSHEIMRQTTDENNVRYNKSGYVALKSVLDNEKIDTISSLNVLFSVLESIKTNQPNTYEDFVEIAVKHFENNYYKDLNVTTLANMLGISRAHFTTSFTKRIGQTPYNYLLNVRINHAKEYLTKTQMSVTEVAYSVGFTSLERFSEMFKQITGLSPLSYKNSFSSL
jgi:AraC-like DNA-binding protein